MKEKLLSTGEWEITWEQIGFCGTYENLEEGRKEVMKKFRGGK